MFINEGPEPELLPHSSTKSTTHQQHHHQQQFSFEAPVNEALTPKVRKSMDICQAYQSNSCTNGSNCPDRHVISNYPRVQPEVCKFWLRGACNNGADCNFLHSFEERLIPECAFFAKLGECTNPECNFRHVHPDEKKPICAAYERGFCPYGPECHLRHVKRPRPCPFYMSGFCPLGQNCTVGSHPVSQRYDRLSVYSRLKKKLTAENAADSSTSAAVSSSSNGNFNPYVTCFKCFDPGHTARNCPGGYYSRVFNELRKIQEPGEVQIYSEDGRAVGCFFCGETSHTLKECPEKEGNELGEYVLNLLVGGGPNNNNNNSRNNHNNAHRDRQYQQHPQHQNRPPRQQQQHQQSSSSFNPGSQRAELKQMVRNQETVGDVLSVPAGFASATKL